MWAILTKDRKSILKQTSNPRANRDEDGYSLPVFTNIDAQQRAELGIVGVPRINRHPDDWHTATFAGWDKNADGTLKIANGDLVPLTTLTPLRPSELQAKLKNKLKQKVDSLLLGTVIYNGYETDVNIDAIAFHAAIGWVEGGKWRMVDNAEVSMSRGEFETFSQVVRGFYQRVLEAYWAHKNAVELITTVEEAAAYDIEANWPATVL